MQSYFLYENSSTLFLYLKHMIPGKLEKGAVLKAICSGFEETTEPAVCLSGGKFILCFVPNTNINVSRLIGF